MKKIFLFIPIAFSVFLFTSCEGPKKSPENQTVNTPSSQSDNQSATKSGDASSDDQSKQADQSQADAKQSGGDLTGMQIVETTLTKLTNKLGLRNDQVAPLKAILNSTFLDMGKDLNKTYGFQESISISRDIKQKAKEQIMGILDADQKAKFSQLGHQ